MVEASKVQLTEGFVYSAKDLGLRPKRNVS